MTTPPKLTHHMYNAVALLLLGLPSIGSAQALIIQPGAPGESPRELSAEEAVEIADTSYSPADARFMRDMIPHHHQALQMAELVADRTNHPELIDVAGRINASQGDEIAFMQNWLRERGEPVPNPTEHDAMHTHHKMAGMATPQQMADLAAANGTDFDRLFLELMITHHEGAVTMVKELRKQPGSAYDPVLYEFTTDVVNDQTTEIERMHTLLVGLSSDPRAGLAAGLDDAGEVIWNLELLTSLPKPDGFFDPQNPAELPPKYLRKDDDESPESEEEEDKDKKETYSRSPLLSFSNTDMAFSGDVLIAGSYHGFNIYRLQKDGRPELLSSVVCPGGQGDVSIVGDLLITSVEETRGRVDCGLQGIDEDVSDERFRGLRIFDISDLTRPVQVGAVQTCRGSHTHSVVAGPGEDGKIIVYNSGTSSVRKEDELAGCIDESPGDDRTALFRIDVIEIPVDDPSKARIVDSPAVFADPETGVLAGLWRGGDHGDETQKTSRTDQCHDITVFPSAGLAAGACSGNGILFDISDPLNPRRIDAVVDAGFAYWHSATFNNDGTKVIFTDEWGGGTRPRCRAYDPLTWGADAIYDIVDGKLEFQSYFKMPAPQVEEENCVAHNGSIVPVPGRDIFVQAWYQGGISVIDFTDSANPVEIAWFDRGPIDEKALVTGGYWSTYWYDGRIYGTEIVRGLDVLRLLPSEYLSKAEIAAANMADQGGVFNPQQQFPVSWPADPVVARAYVDQLSSADALSAEFAADVTAVLAGATKTLEKGSSDKELAKQLRSLAATLQEAGGDTGAKKRRLALSQTLLGIATRCETADPTVIDATPAKTLVSGVKLDALDRNTDPRDDFYQFVNGGWLDTTEIPEIYSGYTVYHEVMETVEDALRDIIESAAAGGGEGGSEAQQVGDVYASWMDIEKINALGIDPAASDLKIVSDVDSIESLGLAMATLYRRGVLMPYSFSIYPDLKNSSRNTIYFSQSGITMPNRDYYLQGDNTNFAKARDELRPYIGKLLQRSGLEGDTATSAADAVYTLETAIAEAQWDSVRNRDPDQTYNAYATDALADLGENLGWQTILQALGVADEQQAIISQPSYFEALDGLLETVPLQTWKHYLAFRVLDSRAPHLDETTAAIRFDYRNRILNGQEEQQPRWKLGIGMVNGLVGEAVGKLYVAEYFPPAAKEKMQELVQNVIATLDDSLGELDWMSEETRVRAKQKLAKFTPKIGYPDEWKDYSNLEIVSGDHFGNLRRAVEWNHLQLLDKLGKPVDKKEWSMTPQTVNAYYSPTKNEIVFPAARLQPPFFQLDADDAINYGAVGGVIGHEISHGFDDKGSKYDGDGNLNNWWTDDDRAAFEQRAQVLIEQFSAFEPIEGMTIKGELTIGENIGDLSGVAMAYRAYIRSLNGEDPPVIDGFTGPQRFFIGYAMSRKGKYSEQATVRRLASGPHSPLKYRVIGPYRNIDAFHEAFGTRPGDGMWLPPEERVRIW